MPQFVQIIMIFLVRYKSSDRVYGYDDTRNKLYIKETVLY